MIGCRVELVDSFTVQPHRLGRCVGEICHVYAGQHEVDVRLAASWTLGEFPVYGRSVVSFKFRVEPLSWQTIAALAYEMYRGVARADLLPSGELRIASTVLNAPAPTSHEAAEALGIAWSEIAQGLPRRPPQYRELIHQALRRFIGLANSTHSAAAAIEEALSPYIRDRPLHKPGVSLEDFISSSHPNHLYDYHMTEERWGTHRTSHGVCQICLADRTMWCDQVAHEQYQ
jgi:hypothetical protein